MRLRVGRAAHQLFFVDVTVFIREQSEKREVRKSSTTTEQETTPKPELIPNSANYEARLPDRPVKTSHTTCRQGHDRTSIFCLQNDATVRRTVTSQLSCVFKPSFTKICIRISLCKTSLIRRKKDRQLMRDRNF